MLKAVGASGQISLGKKYAGQLFDVVFYPDGRVEMVPMKVTPAVQTGVVNPSGATPRTREDAPPYRVGDGWLTPERLALRKAALQSPAADTEADCGQSAVDNQPAPVAMGVHAHERRTSRQAQGTDSTGAWAEAHALEIDQYNAWASQREPYAQRVRRWRESALAQSETGQP